VNLNVRPLPTPDSDEKLLLVSFQDMAQPMSEKLASGLAGHGKPMHDKSGHDKSGHGKGAPGAGERQRAEDWSASWPTPRRICKPPSRSSRPPMRN